MKKLTLNNENTVFLMPTAVISVGKGEDANLITLAYVGKMCSKPPIVAISIHPKRHSYHLIEKYSEFVINYPTSEQLKEIDYCGTRSGRDENKWKVLNLIKEEASIVQIPMVKEFPWNIECKVINKIKLGSHVCYFGELVATHSDSKYVIGNDLNPDEFNFLAYIAGNYIGLKKGALEKHGFSKN